MQSMAMILQLLLAVSALFTVATIVCQGFEVWSGFVMLAIISLKKRVDYFAHCPFALTEILLYVI